MFLSLDDMERGVIFGIKSPLRISRYHFLLNNVIFHIDLSFYFILFFCDFITDLLWCVVVSFSYDN